MFSDSSLCVKSLTEWAFNWEKRDWKKADGKTIENRDLVMEAFSLSRNHPGVSIQWLKGHSGNTWNEYADCLASAWQES